jgi:hypothetical protein
VQFSTFRSFMRRGRQRLGPPQGQADRLCFDGYWVREQHFIDNAFTPNTMEKLKWLVSCRHSGRTGRVQAIGLTRK